MWILLTEFGLHWQSTILAFLIYLDSREPTRQQDKNPEFWTYMKEILPLLSQNQYYKKFKYGDAKGSELIKYIDHIRYFQNVLENSFK